MAKNLDLDEIKRLHDQAYDFSQTTRERASDDLVFTWITHWSGEHLQNSSLGYKGQFDVLRKAIRHIMSELRENPVSVNFHPMDVNRGEAADLMQGLYLTDDRNNMSIEAKINALQEAVITGFGCYQIYTDYEYKRTGKGDLVIKREPIYEACNKVFFDPNAKLQDKSDAKYVSVLHAYSEDGYKELKSELTGENVDDIVIDSNFAAPQQSYSFPWVALGSTKVVYVAEFYYREMVDDKLWSLSDQYGDELEVLESDFKDDENALSEAGYEISDKIPIERYQVTKCVCSGAEILSEEPLMSSRLPVVPIYGERAIIEEEEHYEGIARLAKDPQRLRNFHLSYIADIVSRSPRPKPIFFPEQIKGFEHMYQETGADNNYPYLLQNMISLSGEPLEGGVAGVMPEQEIPDAVMAMIELTREAVEDVANPGVPQNLSDPDLSGKAVAALSNRLDQQAIVYQQNYKHSARYDAEIYAELAIQTYNFQRSVVLTKQDGTQVNSVLMDYIMEPETGMMKVINDLTDLEFSIFASIGASFSSKREQTLESLNEMMANISPEDPMYQILLLKSLELMEGVNFDDVRDYARNRLIVMGVKKPETPEEVMMLQQAQSEEDNPAMLLAQAEMLRATAENTDAQTKAQESMRKVEIEQQKANTQTYDAETKRQKVHLDAAVAGVESATNVQKVQNEAKKLQNDARAKSGNSNTK